MKTHRDPWYETEFPGKIVRGLIYLILIRSFMVPVMRKMGTARAIALWAVLFLAPGSVAPAAEDGGSQPELNADGLHTQPWFLESFLDLKEDMAEAAANGKSFAIIWEQRGCPYCRETHLVNFAVPEIRKFISSNFEILLLNLRGAREVTDFDGEKLSEGRLVRKLGVRYTPTVTFHGPVGRQAGKGHGRARELTRITGYYRPFHFLMAFKYVREKAYQRQKFKDFVVERTAARRKQGKPVRFR